MLDLYMVPWNCHFSSQAAVFWSRMCPQIPNTIPPAAAKVELSAALCRDFIIAEFEYLLPLTKNLFARRTDSRVTKSAHSHNLPSARAGFQILLRTWNREAQTRTAR